ncbi:MAG: preprotein translocase subunit SecE [Solirubrobacterales bacterium]|nr:preprotein translocase subunit SecE [Solirubrobacterales bacterium]
MARNRKRAKERRARRPQPVAAPSGEREEEQAPEPIEHAAPDVELAEAQLSIGRPQLPDDPAEEAQAEEELELAAEEEEAQEEQAAGSSSSAIAERAPSAPGHRPWAGNRFINFVQGSWRELQRVQWPDRRQVMQATGVVIGFVIIAGAFLGVADFVAGKVMNFVLTGHFK